MRKIDRREVIEPKRVISENERDGEIHCSCGHIFKYCMGAITGMQYVNTGEWFGYIVPICPECDTIPKSESRRMDL